MLHSLGVYQLLCQPLFFSLNDLLGPNNFNTSNTRLLVPFVSPNSYFRTFNLLLLIRFYLVDILKHFEGLEV